MHRLIFCCGFAVLVLKHGDVRCGQKDDTRLNVTLKADSGELQRCIIDTIHIVAGPLRRSEIGLSQLKTEEFPA
jgi:hypothetical protein